MSLDILKKEELTAKKWGALEVVLPGMGKGREQRANDISWGISYKSSPLIHVFIKTFNVSLKRASSELLKILESQNICLKTVTILL